MLRARRCGCDRHRLRDPSILTCKLGGATRTSAPCLRPGYWDDPPTRTWNTALRGLLSRHKSLPIRQIVFDIFVHPEHDAACARRGASFLSPLSQRYRYALLIMDHEGSGREKISADDLQEALNQEFRGLYTTLNSNDANRDGAGS